MHMTGEQNELRAVNQGMLSASAPPVRLIHTSIVTLVSAMFVATTTFRELRGVGWKTASCCSAGNPAHTTSQSSRDVMS